MVEIISAYELEATSEEKVYEAAMSWIYYRNSDSSAPSENRILQLTNVFVRFSQAEASFLVGVSRNALIEVNLTVSRISRQRQGTFIIARWKIRIRKAIQISTKLMS